MSDGYPQVFLKKSNQHFLRGQRSNILEHKATIKTLLDEAIQYTTWKLIFQALRWCNLFYKRL